MVGSLRENELVAMLVANRKISASLYTILATLLGGEFSEFSTLVELHHLVEFGGIYKTPGNRLSLPRSVMEVRSFPDPVNSEAFPFSR